MVTDGVMDGVVGWVMAFRFFVYKNLAQRGTDLWGS